MSALSRPSRLLLAFIAFLLFIFPVLAYNVPNSTTVYVTPSGLKYHRESCSYTSSVRAMTIDQAVHLGYSPCSRCDPDKLTGEYTSDWIGTSGSPSASYKHTPTTRVNASAKGSTLSDFPYWGTVIGGSLLAGMYALFSPSAAQSREEKRNKASRKTRWVSTYAEKSFQQAFSVPPGFTLDNQDNPCRSNGDNSDLIVYVTKKSTVYHTSSCRYARQRTCKLWEAKRNARTPCSFCKPTDPDFSWYFSYLRAKSEMKSDGISLCVKDNIIHLSDQSGKRLIPK